MSRVLNVSGKKVNGGTALDMKLHGYTINTEIHMDQLGTTHPRFF